MFHRLRSLHRWIGVTASLFLLLLSVTGFLLATKKTVDWIRPTERNGAKVASLTEVITIHDAAEAAYALGLAELKHSGDIDRIDYRPGDNVFKIVTKEGYHEVQVDGKSGKVVNLAKRNDQFIEDLHDFSWFADAAHQWGLPVVALGLFGLAITGVTIFFVPVARRWKYKRSKTKGSP